MVLKSALCNIRYSNTSSNDRTFRNNWVEQQCDDTAGEREDSSNSHLCNNWSCSSWTVVLVPSIKVHLAQGLLRYSTSSPRSVNLCMGALFSHYSGMSNPKNNVSSLELAFVVYFKKLKIRWVVYVGQHILITV